MIFVLDDKNVENYRPSMLVYYVKTWRDTVHNIINLSANSYETFSFSISLYDDG